TVIVSFNAPSGLTAGNLTTLTLAGVLLGKSYPALGMVAVPATAGQVRALAANPSVRSLWLDDPLRFLNNQTRVIAGVDRLRADPAFIALNGNQPVTGHGNFSLLINDSGIDGTHLDLPFGSHLIQNVQALEEGALNGITPFLFLENVPDTDTNVGHGTHCAGIA